MSLSVIKNKDGRGAVNLFSPHDSPSLPKYCCFDQSRDSQWMWWLSYDLKEITMGAEILCSRMTLLGNHFIIVNMEFMTSQYLSILNV